MDKCKTLNCPGTQTKDSDYCLSCETRGYHALRSAIHGEPYPPVVTPPPHIWDRIKARIEEKEGEK